MYQHLLMSFISTKSSDSESSIHLLISSYFLPKLKRYSLIDYCSIKASFGTPILFSFFINYPTYNKTYLIWRKPSSVSWSFNSNKQHNWSKFWELIIKSLIKPFYIRVNARLFWCSAPNIDLTNSKGLSLINLF